MYHAYDKIPIQLPHRVALSLICVGVAFFFIAARLWYLQAIRGEYFAEQSQNNRQRSAFVPPPRGVIRDRNGEVLAKNRPAFNIELFINETKDVDATLSTLSEIVDVPVQELQETLSKQYGARFRPRVLVRDASREQVERVVAHRPYLQGISVSHFPIRWYAHKDLASHVIGHIREISKRELSRPEYSSYYRAGDLIGKYGLELKWERYLQGRRGKNSFVVNAHGVKMHDLPDRLTSIAGNTLELTIDKDVQIAADEALRGQWGGVVALKPSTGEVLALSSAPAFDPNIFTGKLSGEQWKSLVSGKEKRLSNRAVQGAFPPGSVFKVFMGIAGLSEKVISPATTEYCPGHHRFGNRTFRCHKRSGHGWVNLKKALMVSCDVYFYILGEKLGVDRIHEYATLFGLGKKTNLDLIHESPGLIPSTAWKKKRFAGTEQETWFPGETLSVAIGQGAALATPLQMAVSVAAVVNGGEVLKPYLVKAVYSGDGSQLVEQGESTVQAKVDLPAKYFTEVRKGMELVVSSPEGTARRARLPKSWEIATAGKTGTSQVVALKKKGDKKEFEHHAWYVGYAPADKPEIVVAALVEHGGGGGKAAAPVVRKVFEAYFQKTRGLELPESAQVAAVVSEDASGSGNTMEGQEPSDSA